MMREMKIFWFYSSLLRVFGSFLISAVTVAVIEPATTHTTCNQINTRLRYFRNHSNFWPWFALANLNLGWKSWRLIIRISLKLRFSTRLHGHISSFQWIDNGTTHNFFPNKCTCLAIYVMEKVTCSGHHYYSRRP